MEFNFGRAFHQIGDCRILISVNILMSDFNSLGLFHYAKKHYERVLSNTSERRKLDPNVSLGLFGVHSSDANRPFSL